MKLIVTCCAWLLLFILPTLVFGQSNTLSNAYLVKTYAFYKNTNPNLNHLNYFEAMAGAMHLPAQSRMVLTEESAGEKGYTHYKYQQFQAGLPIFGNHYILHEKAGIVVTATGLYSPQADVSVTPGINAATAVAFAEQTMHAREYDPRKIEPILCLIDPAFPKVSETLRLAYQVDLHSTAPFDKQRYFVDAGSGKIITHFPLLLREGVPSTAKTRYYGIQQIITDSISPQQFRLRDLTRGGGIFINNGEGSDFTSTSSNWDLTNDQQDEVALDAHYCIQEYYDMMLADYNWQGQDGNGKALVAYVHDGDFANAFWDGEATRYGDGDCNYGPLTTLEVMGHEFTHGMVDYTSKLVYEEESGAINESLADMFGKMLEYKTDPSNFSWLLGHSFRISPDVAPFRIMDDPNSIEMPAYYQGEYWTDGNDPHINSAIGNLWFSMLVDGKQGVNEAGIAFQVPALGMNKAGQIVFQVNRNYFTENSNYNAFYQYSVEVAETLYGAGSTEMQAVLEAWKAVGVSGGMPSNVLDLALEGNFDFQNFCDPGEYLPVTFKVINTSNVAYNPATMATVTLSDNQQGDYTVHLTTPIGPGEMFEIHVNNWLEASGYAHVAATLDLADDNSGNNYSDAYYNVLEFASNDLSLYAYLPQQKCFDTVLRINVYINNNSCETIPAGTVVNLAAIDGLGNLIWSSPYTLAEELIATGGIFTTFDLPLANSPLTITLIYPDDPDLDNNQYQDYSTHYAPITGNYLNTFEIDYGQDNYLELPYDGIASNVLYQNTHYFASTGQAEDAEEIERCADIFSVFNYEFVEGLNDKIHACLDFSASPAPKLEFDLVQFRNSTNYAQSSMLQASWKGTESGNLIIYGQPEGLVKHHDIALPPFFKGALDFKFYTEVGIGIPDPSFFGEADFVLLDNVRLSAPTSGTEESATQANILISPNPAREAVTIQAADAIRTIRLQNANGQTLQTIEAKNATTHLLDLKGLSNGFYLLHIQLENGQRGVRKIVKMD